MSEDYLYHANNGKLQAPQSMTTWTSGLTAGELPKWARILSEADIVILQTLCDRSLT